MAERVARVYAGHLPVALFAPPLTLPRFTIGAYWNERDERDPVLHWLRARVRSLGIERSARLRLSRGRAPARAASR